MSERRKALSQAAPEPERNIPDVLKSWHSEFWNVKSGGFGVPFGRDRYVCYLNKMRQIYALTAMYWGYLHGQCVHDRMKYDLTLHAWSRCEPREPKTWCLYHGQTFMHVNWSAVKPAEREFAKRLAASLTV